jgi:iron complex transport system ATP-binding protein
VRHAIAAEKLAFAYRPDKPVLRGVDFAAAAGRFVCILGPNGSGKTTLLRCLLGAAAPTGGRILLDGVELARHSPRELARLLAYVPQFPQSSFAYSVREIVLMGRLAHMGVLGLAGEQDVAVAHQAMLMTDTQRFAERTLEELSGGEAQCVMIARALAQQPSVMLLDEPTSHLDVRNQLTIYRMMGRLAHDWEMAVVCVSHDINMAARAADELVLMRQGEVIARGAPRDVIRRDVLEQLYDVSVELVPVSGDDVPLVAVR